MGTPDDPLPDAAAGYCELHAHSNFSFLDGASHPEELIGRAAQLGMPALAVTDHAGLYAAVRLWKAAGQTCTDEARGAGLSPVTAIVGLELAIPRDEGELRLARRGRKLNDPLRGERASRGWPGELHAGPIPGDHIILLARDATGYASLSYLKRLPVDCLKIDRSLVKGVGYETEDTAVIRAVVSLAHSLGITVTAEGIETQDQLGQLRAVGCDQGQGYFFARPVSADRVPELLASLGADERNPNRRCAAAERGLYRQRRRHGGRRRCGRREREAWAGE